MWIYDHVETNNENILFERNVVFMDVNIINKILNEIVLAYKVYVAKYVVNMKLLSYNFLGYKLKKSSVLRMYT